MLYRLTIDAFPASPELDAALATLAEDPLFARSRLTRRPGGLAAAVAHYHAEATPQVVIVEETGDDPLLLERLAALAEVCVAGSQVMVVGRHNDIGLYRRLMARGVSDYLVAPVTAAQLAAALQSLFADPRAAPRGRLIAFYGARGGVGSSSLAHHAAWSLARQTGEDVVAADLDLAFGTLGLAFNSEARQTVGELLGDPERIDGQLLERLRLKYDEHLHLLPSPAELRPWPPIEVEGVDRLMDGLREMSAFAVLDLPHVWAPWVAHALQAAEELVIVATPDLASLREVKSLTDGTLRRPADRPAPRLVLNKLDALKKSQLSPRDFEETLKLTPALILPFDPIFGEACNNGQMIGEFARGHRVAEALDQFALQLAGRPAARRAKAAAPGLGGWLKKFRPAR